MTALRLCVLLTLALTACTKTDTSPGAADASAKRDAAPPPTASSPISALFPPASATASAAPPDPAVLAAKGKVLYGRYCNHCHADDGRGYKNDEAPMLASDDLLSIATDEYLQNAILEGRPGTTMSAWSVASGGPLGVAEAQQLIAFFRTWEKRPQEALEPHKAAGDATRGAAIYAANCVSCHGVNGANGKYVQLANYQFLTTASDAFLARTIARGRAGTTMAAFEPRLGPDKIDDVIAALRSWMRPQADPLDLPPVPGKLEKVVLNPGGAQPAFEATADFVKIDRVKAELDKKASMVIIDSRAPSDYARMHVAGAISVPFYDVEKYAAQIPKDRYLLTYCACPHGSSVRGREAFRAAGYKHVAVLDEGINAWRDRGYPVRGGSKP